jgi:hypothetical protein
MKVGQVSQLIQQKANKHNNNNIPMRDMLTQSCESVEFQSKYIQQHEHSLADKGIRIEVDF